MFLSEGGRNSLAQLKYARSLPSPPIILVNPATAAHYLLEGRALVCLVRHGQTDWNKIKRLQGREDVPLNECGHAQARVISSIFATAKKLGVSFGTVCSSPLERAVVTANYIAESLELPESIVVDRLIECDYGSLSGLTPAERRKLYPRGGQLVRDAETVPHAASRMISAFDDMLELSGRKTVIGVTHGGIINAVYSRLTSGEIGTGKTLTMNCSISCVAAGIGEPIPLAYNLQSDGASAYLRKLLTCGADI